MTYQELIQQPDYVQLASVPHSEIKSFIKNEISEMPKWARIANMYQLIGLLAFMLGLFKAFMPFFVYREVNYLIWLGWGTVFTFTFLIILHEFIHAIAYWCIGSRHLTFGFQLKKFLFYVECDKEVINYQQFKKIALAPTIAVTILSLLGMILFYQQQLFYFFLPIFSLHSLFAAGDFGLLCFFQNRPDWEIVTFDVKEEQKTYFYGKKKQN